MFSLLAVILIFIIVFGYSFRDILQKYTASRYSNHFEAGAIPAIFSCIGVLLLSKALINLWHPSYVNYYYSHFSFWDTIKNNKPNNIVIEITILIGIMKGIIVFLLNSGARNLDLSTVSGSSYLAFVSLGIGSLINHFIFGEKTLILPIVVIALCSLVFYIYGPGKKIIFDKKLKVLLSCIIGLSLLIVIDYIGIRASNWFVHLALSNIVAFLLFIALIKQKIIKNFSFLSDKMIILSGATYAFMDFMFVFSFSILGVSYAFLFGMLSYLPTMVLGSTKYKEGKWYVQTAFAVIAILCVYIIAFEPY